jgi:hypothetical protein
MTLAWKELGIAPTSRINAVASDRGPEENHDDERFDR